MHTLTRRLEHVAVAVALLLPLLVAPAFAQALKPDPGPEEEGAIVMARMTREMSDMRAEMERMQGEMGKHGMGMGPMRERMAGMSERMGRMAEMMKHHHGKHGAQCPAMNADPKSGG